jgi:hypothetical protein
MGCRWAAITCIGVLLLASGVGSVAAEQPIKVVEIAALDSPSGPPPCGQDGICNAAACAQDPDCPKKLPGKSSSTSPTPDRAVQHLSDHPVSTSPSGKAPTNKTLTKAASANGAIYGVTIGEDTDDPCYMEIKYRDVATQEAQTSLKFSECAGHKVGDPLTPSLPSGAFVTGVQICLNSAGNKLKGIELIGNYDACILGAETVTVAVPPCTPASGGVEYNICDPDAPAFKTVSCDRSLTSFVKRPHCPGPRREPPDEDWEKEVSCPARMVATGMKLRTIDGSGDRKMIDGVALVCDTLVPAR